MQVALRARSEIAAVELLLFSVFVFGSATAASAVPIDWTLIGNPGNAPDITGFGAVGYSYNIGTYEVTNEQYAEFLNAKAATDTLLLYSTGMAAGGITRSGLPGSFTYAAVPTREDIPVNHVSFFDALRFANWQNNGKGAGDTETGAYTLLGGTPTPTNAFTVTRNPGATIFLTSEDEWYKAAYSDALSVYYGFPAGSNIPTGCAPPSPTPNTANCNLANIGAGGLSIKGSYTGSASPWGTFDQGGNVAEWTEASLSAGSARVFRGGNFAGPQIGLAAGVRSGGVPEFDDVRIGFRLASVPEPGTGLLVLVGLLGLACRRQHST